MHYYERSTACQTDDRTHRITACMDNNYLSTSYREVGKNAVFLIPVSRVCLQTLPTDQTIQQLSPDLYILVVFCVTDRQTDRRLHSTAVSQFLSCPKVLHSLTNADTLTLIPLVIPQPLIPWVIPHPQTDADTLGHTPPTDRRWYPGSYHSLRLTSFLPSFPVLTHPLPSPGPNMTWQTGPMVYCTMPNLTLISIQSPLPDEKLQLWPNLVLWSALCPPPSNQRKILHAKLDTQSTLTCQIWSGSLNCVVPGREKNPKFGGTCIFNFNSLWWQHRATREQNNKSCTTQQY